MKNRFSFLFKHVYIYTSTVICSDLTRPRFRVHLSNCLLFACSQDGLRRRMDKLKSSIEEANLAVDKEREKNVSLLHMIFPPNIAKRLWLGEYSFPSRSIENSRTWTRSKQYLLMEVAILPFRNTVDFPC